MIVRLRLVLMLLAIVAFIAPARAQFTDYGRGTGLDVSILTLLGVTVADTGLLPPSGGTLSASLGSASLSSGLTTVVTTGIISAGTTGAAGVVNSSATVDGLRVFPSITDLVSATTVQSSVFANTSSANGSSVVENLRVLGVPVTVTGAPNQTVSVPGVLNLTINRQTVTGGVLRVDALYLDVLSPLNAGQIAVASSYAGVAAAPEPSSLALLGLVIPGAFAIIRRRRI